MHINSTWAASGIISGIWGRIFLLLQSTLESLLCSYPDWRYRKGRYTVKFLCCSVEVSWIHNQICVIGKICKVVEMFHRMEVWCFHHIGDWTQYRPIDDAGSYVLSFRDRSCISSHTSEVAYYIESGISNSTNLVASDEWQPSGKRWMTDSVESLSKVHWDDYHEFIRL